MITKALTDLNRRADELARRLASEGKSGKIIKQQIVLLEIIGHEEERLQKLGYCDFELAYICFGVIEFLVQVPLLTGSELLSGIREVLKKKQQFKLKIVEFLTENGTLEISGVNEINDPQTQNGDQEVDDLFERFNRLKGLPKEEKVGQNGNSAIETNGNATLKQEMEVDFDKLKYSELISSKQLYQLINSPQKSSILLIDYRTKKEFDYNHIKFDNLVCIQPSWVSGLPLDAVDSDLDKRLQLLMPDEQYSKFRKRSQYEIIVIYNLKYGPKDDRFEALEQLLMEENDNSGIPSASPFQPLIKLISFKTKYLSTKLKRSPVFLGGGVNHWYELFGEKVLEKTIQRTPLLLKPLATLPRGTINTITAAEEHKRRNRLSKSDSIDRNVLPSFYLKSFNDYINTAATTPSQAPIPTSTLSSKLPLAQNFNFVSSSTPPPTIPAKISLQNQSSPSNGSSTKTTESLPTFLLYVSCGLTNLGNSCYMNCVLQCLAATPQLTGFFFLTDSVSYKQHININNSLGTKGIITTNFVQLLSSMFSNDGKVFTPLHFKKVVGSLSPSKVFALFDQQDCIEFLNFVLDSIHEDLNQMAIYSPQEKQKINELTEEQERARELLPVRLALTIEWERYLKLNFSIIVDYFQGQYLSRLECLECGMSLTTYNAFLTLSLPISVKNNMESVSLEDCLQEFVKLEYLDEANKWHCPRCKKFTRLTKKINITRLPQVLIIHFKRFKMKPNGYIDKINAMITYPVEKVLDLTPYWPTVGTNLVNKQEISVERESEMLATLPTRNQIPPFRYKLYGVVTHFGNLLTGHYTSYVYKSNKNKSKKGGWCYFDDAKITYNVKESTVLNSNAYCLFYQRVRD